MRETGGLWLWREERGDREGERGGGGLCEGHGKDISPSHMVVEMVLYGCVCLSVPFRIFTGKCRGPAVCNNISPSLRSSFTTLNHLCFCCYPRNLLAVVIVTDGQRWLWVGTGSLAFCNNFTPEPAIWLLDLYSAGCLCVLVCVCLHVCEHD